MRTPTLVVALLVFTASAAAQVPPSDSARLAALARLKPSATLRLQGPAIGVVQARLGLLSGDSIMTGRWQPERRVPLAAAESIWVLHNGADKAAAVGGLVLGLAFGVLGARRAGDDSGERATRGFMVGAGIGVALGVTLGALVGGADESWERVYPPF